MKLPKKWVTRSLIILAMFYFSYVFKKNYGVAPTEFRKQNPVKAGVDYE